MVFNTAQEKKLGEQLVGKLQNIEKFFIVDKYFHSSIQNFLMWNESAIESRDLSKFDTVCIMNGIHKISNPINTIFQSESDPTYLWDLLNYLLIVYNPFYELSKDEVNKIEMFIKNKFISLE